MKNFRAKRNVNLISQKFSNMKNFTNTILFILSVTVICQSQNTGNVGIGTETPTAKLHIAGDIKIDSLIGASERNVTVGPDGKLRSVPFGQEEFPRSKLELTDDNGDVRMRFDANRGTFEMLDDGETFYSVAVQSPPGITERGAEITNMVITDDETMLEVMSILSIDMVSDNDDAITTALYNRMMICIGNGTLSRIFLQLPNNQINNLENGEDFGRPYQGTVWFKDGQGKLHRMEFAVSENDDRTDNTDITIKIPTKEISSVPLQATHLYLKPIQETIQRQRIELYKMARFNQAQLMMATIHIASTAAYLTCLTGQEELTPQD